MPILIVIDITLLLGIFKLLRKEIRRFVQFSDKLGFKTKKNWKWLNDMAIIILKKFSGLDYINPNRKINAVRRIIRFWILDGKLYYIENDENLFLYILPMEFKLVAAWIYNICKYFAVILIFNKLKGKFWWFTKFKNVTKKY